MGYHPEPLFLLPRAAKGEGSPIVKKEISRYARNDKMGRGCLSTARQDRAESFIEKIQLAKSSNKV